MANSPTGNRTGGSSTTNRTPGTSDFDYRLPRGYDAQVEQYVGLEPGTFSRIEQEAVARKKRPLLEALRDRLHLRREQIGGTTNIEQQSTPIAETPQTTTTVEGPSGQGRV